MHRSGDPFLVTTMVITFAGSAFLATRTMVGDSMVAAMLAMLTMLTILPIAATMLRRSPIGDRRQS
jgi:hypothetical protein